MSDDPGKPGLQSPQWTMLEEHAAAMRVELLRLRQDLDQVQQEFTDTHAAQLLAANEQLVLTALKAETTAETAMAKLREMAHVTQHDSLTDTPNRALMLDRLQNAIALAKRRETHFAVLFVDIDRFKDINDTHGHSIGDEVLQLVARRLEAAVRDSDTVSRHSGDEFVVLLAEITQASDAALIATKMHAAIAGAADEQALPFPVSVSIGIAIYPEDGQDVSSLIDRADQAMYRSKRMGGGRLQFHRTESAWGDIAEQPSDKAPRPRTRSRTGQGQEERHLQNLRNANEQLVLSSLAAHESEARATQARASQVRFLAMVAHELRNPLAPIRTAAELLNRVRTDEQQHGHLQEIIKRQVAHMARIVDDLLDGSRAGSGKFHLERTSVDLIEVINVAINSCDAALNAKLQHLRTQLPTGPLVVYGDSVRLAQIFRNLLDNAIKYTPKGGAIALTAAVAQDAVLITVSDNGIGISAAALPHVFDLFVQDLHAVAAHGGGLGIGLAVVRELVEAHGGSVIARSAGHHRGTEFFVTLPLHADGSPSA